MAQPDVLPAVALDGETYHLRISEGALRRIREAEVDFCNPPRRSDAQGFVRYLVVVFAAAAYLELDGKLKHAGLTIADAEDILAPCNIKPISVAVNDAIVQFNFHNNQNAASDDGEIEGPAIVPPPLVN